MVDLSSTPYEVPSSTQASPQAPEIYVDECGDRRMRNTELVIPIVGGTVAFYLGKKATEYSSHKWTVFLRGLNGEDMSHIISKVVFELHHTFTNPLRAVEKQPFEVEETGWGEFDIGITAHFVPEAREKEVTFYHRLRLYEEDGQQQKASAKPVVAETYEELVFWEPTETLYNKIRNHVQARSAPQSQLGPYFGRANEADELNRLRACRAKIAAIVHDMQQDFEGAR